MVLSFGAMTESGTPPVSGILVRIAFCLLLANGAQAANKLKKSSSPLVPHA